MSIRSSSTSTVVHVAGYDDDSAGDGTARTGYCVYMGKGIRSGRGDEDNDMEQQA
jgi:hypothetical protein